MYEVSFKILDEDGNILDYDYCPSGFVFSSRRAAMYFAKHYNLSTPYKLVFNHLVSCVSLSYFDVKKLFRNK